jgi:sulfur relay protein TusB/DsrH
MLHIIPQAHRERLENCQKLAHEEDALLFMADGVYLLTQEALLAQLTGELFVIAADLKARGLSPKGNAEAINYDDFVALTIKHTQIQTW